MKRKLGLFLGLLLSFSIVTGCTSQTNTEEDKALQENAQVTKTEYTYDNNDYLVDINWVKENINNESIVIIDARDAKLYKKGHIPKSINATWQSFAIMEGKAGDPKWGTLQDAKGLSKRFSELGIDDSKTVIVYSNKDGWGEDGRLVWMFKEAGIDARMLDGGMDLWEASKNDTVKEVPTITATEYNLQEVKEEMTITTEELNKNLDKLKVIDTREKDEYEGAQKFGEARGGHIKGAINLTFNQVYNSDGTIKSKEELEKIFTDAGLKKDDEIVTYCTSGIRSAHLALILELVGYENVKNYDASFYEWAANKAYPVEK